VRTGTAADKAARKKKAARRAARRQPKSFAGGSRSGPGGTSVGNLGGLRERAARKGGQIADRGQTVVLVGRPVCLGAF